MCKSLQFTLVSVIAILAEASATGTAVIPFGGLTDLGACDDCSSGFTQLGFEIDFYGAEYNAVYVNNNGNLTLNDPLAQNTPSALDALGMPIIAPFFADVDTRAGNTVEYGTGILDGYRAFVATYPYVGCYNENTGVLNDFQVVLIDRPDLGVSSFGDDFQIEFNYGQIQWDAGEASGGNVGCTGAPNGYSAIAGFSDGTSANTFELPGSQVSGAFLDTNSFTGLIYNDVNSDLSTSVPASGQPVPGRYIFTFENGQTQLPTPEPSTTIMGLAGGAILLWKMVRKSRNRPNSC